METPRLRLRRARPDDIGALHGLMSSLEVMRYWSRAPHTRLDESKAYLAGLIAADGTGGADEWVIEVGGKMVGKAGMWRRGEIGFFIGAKAWGQGLAREALTAIIPRLFSAHDLAELTADADPRNAASLRLLARLGFRETGRAEKTILWGEEWCDSVYLTLSRQDWEGAAS